MHPRISGVKIAGSNMLPHPPYLLYLSDNLDRFHGHDDLQVVRVLEREVDCG